LARTVCRQSTQFELDEAGIRARDPLAMEIRRENLRSMQLDHDLNSLCNPQAPGA